MVNANALVGGVAAAALVLVTVAAAPAPPASASPTMAAPPVAVPNAERPLQQAELLAVLALPRAPDFRPDIIAAQTTIRRDQPTRGANCADDTRRTCALGELERTDVDAPGPVVKVRREDLERLPSGDAALEGTFLFASSWNGLRLMAPLAMPTGSHTVPLTPDAMALADDLPIGSIIAASGWLSRIGEPGGCPSETDGADEAALYQSPFVSCPRGLLTAEPFEMSAIEAAAPVAQFGVPVQPYAIERARDEGFTTWLVPRRQDLLPGQPGRLGVTTTREPATYLLRSVANPDPGAEPMVGWKVIGRLDAITAWQPVEPVAGAQPSGLAWEPLADVHPALDGRHVQVTAWSRGFASVQSSDDGNITAWSSADGRTWRRAAIPLAIKRAGNLLPLRTGLVLTANERSAYRQSASFTTWRSADGLSWRRAGALHVDAPARYRDDRQLTYGPWSLDGRLVMLVTYTNEPCCGSRPGIFVAARTPDRSRSSTYHHTSAWVSRDGAAWTKRRTSGLNGAGGGAGERFGYLIQPGSREVLASLTSDLGRSADGLRWLKDVPLPSAYDDTSPAVVARTPRGFVLAGESFDGGPGPGNWLTIWSGTRDGSWTRVFEHGQRSPDAIAVAGSTVIIVGDELDPATADLDETLYYPWILVSTDGGATWDESLSWTGTTPMCPATLTANDDTVVLTFGCVPPGMATTYVVDLATRR